MTVKYLKSEPEDADEVGILGAGKCPLIYNLELTTAATVARATKLSEKGRFFPSVQKLVQCDRSYRS
jgi:hypothetical protein